MAWWVSGRSRAGCVMVLTAQGLLRLDDRWIVQGTQGGRGLGATLLEAAWT